MQIACNPHLYSEKAIQDNLFATLSELLKQILFESKAVIYAHHNITLEGLMDRLDEFAPALVYGGKRRSNIRNDKDVQRFLTNPDCQILLAHPLSAGVGLNFQSVSNYVIFYEPTPIHGQFSQAMDRVFRSGQRKAVVVYILKLLGTVYPSMLSSMLDSSDKAGLINCDKSTFSEWVFGA